MNADHNILWRAPAPAIYLLWFALLGCNSIIVINIGGVTRQAAGVNTPLAPEVQCAALAGVKVKVYPATIDPSKVCGEKKVKP